MNQSDYWVKENKAARKILRDLHLHDQVILPAWADVRTALLQSRARNVLDGLATTGNLNVQGTAYAWAPQNGVNLGGQYQNLSTVKFGQRIYIKVYGQNEIGTLMGQCPLPDFALRVIKDLLTLAHYRSGRLLLHSIDNALNGGNILIKFCDGFTSTSQVDGIAGFDPGNLPAYTGAARGHNRNVYVQYNPAIFGLPIMVGNNDPAYNRGQFGHPAQKPADVTLIHELIHADDCVNGVFDATLVQRGTVSVKLSELRAVGLDALRGSRYSENAYRAERGFVERTYYSDPNGETAAPLVPIVLPGSHGHLLHHLGIDAPVPEETSHAQVVPRLHGSEMLNWLDFKAQSKAQGMRNKVKPIDTAVKDLDAKIAQLQALNNTFELAGMTGMDAAAIRDLLRALYDACETYLNLPERQTSDRVPGVRALQQEAARFFLLYAIAGGAVTNYNAYFTAMSNPRVRDVDGNSQFGLAIERSRDATNLNWLIARGVDVNDRHRGIRPLDFARISGLIGPERVLAAQPRALSDLPDTITAVNVDNRDACLRCLEAGTWVDPATGFNKTNGYRALWDSNNGLLRPILKAAAIAMYAGPRLAAVRTNNLALLPVPLRVYVYGPGKSTCHTSNSVVTVLRYSSQQAIEGGLIHEVSHFVNLNIFANQVMPFPAADPTSDGNAYIRAIASDIQRAGQNDLQQAVHPFLHNPAPGVNGATKTLVDRQPSLPNADGLPGTATNADRFVFTLFNRLKGYLNGTMFRGVPIPILQEAIVSFPQALHCYGDANDATTHAPEMFKYFRDTWLQEVSDWVDARKLQRNRRLSLRNVPRVRLTRQNSVG